MATNTYVALDTQTLVSNTQYVNFTNIPQTYTDLVIVCNVKDSGGGTVNTQMQVGNGSYDSGSNYSWTWLGGSGSSTASNRGSNQTGMLTGAIGTTSFSTTIINLQNYANTTTQKTFLCKNGLADQSSGQSLSLWAGVWQNTSAINQLRLFPGGQSFATGSTFTIYGIAAEGISPTPKATGGAIYSDSTYYYHVFGSTGVFTPSTSLSADILVVAGGGSGAGRHGGGGGAGGLLAFTSQSLTATNYTCTVGAGGTATGTSGRGTSGGPSQFGALTATVGGGAGGSGGGSNSSLSGGSGGAGGASAALEGGTGSAGTAGQGYSGGDGSGYSGSSYYAGGGGGGAGGAGQSLTDTANSPGGYGGIGATSTLIQAIGAASGVGQNVSGTYYIAGGGGGGNWNSSTGAQGIGGNGGGGNGGKADPSNATSGLINTGSGGGGGGLTSAGGTGVGGNGGSGVVIVRYLKA